MKIKISKILKEISEESKVSPVAYNFDEFTKENKKINLPSEDSLYFKEEMYMRVLIGKDWRQQVSKLYGSDTPHMILQNLDKLFKESCVHDIHNLKEAERLWAKTNGREPKIDNIVGFLSCEGEKQRHRYIRSHGWSSNFKIFGKLFAKNVISKGSQILLAHGAVWGIGALGIATSHLMFPVTLLAMGLGVIAVKTALTLPKEMERLERYDEEDQMVLSRSHHLIKTQSLKENLALRKASFEEVAELIKKMDLRTKFALRNMSLEKLRSFADDVFEKQMTYLQAGIKKSEKEISKEVYQDYKKDVENSKILSSGHKDTLKGFGADFVCLAVPVGFEAFEVFEKAHHMVPETTKKEFIDFAFRLLAKVPEFVALYKETSQEHKIEHENLTHAKSSNDIRVKLKALFKNPSLFKIGFEECTHPEAGVAVFQMKTREELMSKVISSKNHKKPLAEALENINKKIM